MFLLSVLHQGVLTIPRLLLGTIHRQGFLKFSLCTTVKLFLKHHTSCLIPPLAFRPDVSIGILAG